MQWLCVLKRINMLYQHDDIPSIGVVESLTADANSFAIDNMIVSHDEKDLVNELREGDDVAEIRTKIVDNEELLDGDENMDKKPLQSLTSSYITSGRKRRTKDLKKDVNRLHAILQNFEDDSEMKEGNDKNKEVESNLIEGMRKDIIVKSKRRIEQLSEFSCNEKIIASSFFHLFLLGKGYQRNNGLLPQHQRHLLLQHTGTAGRCHELIFFLFDQKQRHSNISGINSVVRNHKGCFEQFTSLVRNKGFRKLVTKAKRDPNSKEAKQILKIVTPVLTTGGNKTSFGSLERNNAISRINAMCLRYGMPTLFLTVSIDDVNNFNS